MVQEWQHGMIRGVNHILRIDKLKFVRLCIHWSPDCPDYLIFTNHS